MKLSALKLTVWQPGQSISASPFSQRDFSTLRIPSHTVAWMMLLQRPSQVALLIAAILPCVKAEPQESNDLRRERWLFPEMGSTPVYNYLDIVNASWTSTYNPPTLILWCQDAAADAINKTFLAKYSQTVPRSGNRLIPLNYDGVALGCHFEVLSANAIRSGKRLVSTFTSDPFTVDVVKGRQSVTWSQDNAAQASTALGTVTASQTGTSVTPSKASTAPAATTSASQDELSTAMRAGIVMSAAVGVLALVAGIAALVWLGRRRQRRLDRSTGPYKAPKDMSEELRANDLPQEMEATPPSQELPASPLARALRPA